MAYSRKCAVLKSFLIQWIFLAIMVKEINSSVIKTPHLHLKVSVTPTSEVVAGDTVVYTFEISHTKKSYSNAVDVELQVHSPVYLAYGSVRDGSFQPQNVSKSTNSIKFLFANISMNRHVMFSLDVHVDYYYMVASRDQVMGSSVISLKYYGESDSCHRPVDKWNARSVSQSIQFTFLASKACERVVGRLDESQFSASSFYKLNFNSLGNSPHHASFQHDNVWTPASTMQRDINQYLQIQMKQLTRVTKIGTKGNGEILPRSFVKRYIVRYSRNGIHWSMITDGMKAQEFHANTDSTTVKVNILKVPIEAKFLRIIPKTWKTKIALKVELFGCPVYRVPDGYQPLGLSYNYPPYNARLDLNHSPGGWCTSRSSKQTLVIDLESDHVITELAVQSKFQVPDRLIESFYLSYKKEGGTETDFKENGKKKLFLGNPVEDTTIRHKLMQSVKARYIYFKPNGMSNTGCFRIELYGYKEENVTSSDYCSIIDFENGGLTNWTKSGSAFDNQPTFHDNLHARTGQMVNHEGAWWIGTREKRRTQSDLPGQTQGNNPTGSLTSPDFVIPSSKLFFLFAGTPDPNKARVELLVDDTVVRVASSQTGNESMVPMSWDVKDWIKNLAKIRLVDNAADGFVSFDGLKASCFPSNEQLPVFERSFLLDPSKNILYICHHSDHSDSEKVVCRLTSDNGNSWQDLSTHVSGLLGVHEISRKLYGVSRNWKYYIESTDWTGKVWKHIDSTAWESVKNDPKFISVLEIPHIPVTGLTETDGPSTILSLTSNSGNKFAASSLGIHHRPPSGTWKLIAKWSCQEYPSVCISNPCSNGGSCQEKTDGGFHCICTEGFTGEMCDVDVDDCQNNSCLNGGQCLDGFNKYFCKCNSFYTGQRCEKNIDDCAGAPCSVGASCIDGLGNFTCQCPSGFVGELCEINSDECASVPCQNGGLCVDGVNSYRCHCRKGYSGTNCEHVHSSAFEVISSRSVVYGSGRYLVVHARLPPDGRSFHQTWCHDYKALCYSLNKTRPTGCGRAFNHISENHQCLTTYESVMDHNNTLGCPPNDQVSAIANMAGYGNSNPDNSFAFSQCTDSNCTDLLPQSGCHGALSCINQGVSQREVYTLCSDPDSNFVVNDKRETWFKGSNYLALYVKPRTSTSKHENWCRDYQRLCESYGKRPTGCGQMFSSQSFYSQCQKDYFSVMPDNNELGCENPLADVVGRSAGLPSTSARLGFHKCSSSTCVKEIPVCDGLRCLNNTNIWYHALCTEPRTSFTVLDERRTTVNNVSLLVIKARIPLNRKSTQENWCKDYYTLCDSYGLRPTGSTISHDHEYTSCRDDYGSIMIGWDFLGPEPQFKVAEIAKQVGFTSATSSNSFAFHKCTECPPVLSSNDCSTKGLGCVKPSKHQDVYTVCVDRSTVFDVLETKAVVYNNTAYLVVKTKLPENRIPNPEQWRSAYEQLCSSYGRHPIKCGSFNGSNSSVPAPSSNTSNIHCPTSSFSPVFCHNYIPDEQLLERIAQKAGFSDASKNISLVFDSKVDECFSSKQKVVYAICRGPESNFDVISTKNSSHNWQTYLIIEARLPSHGLSRFSNWCEDYKRLCHSYGQRPTGCEGEPYTSVPPYTSCRDSYGSLVPEDNALGCPSNHTISMLANRVGFCDANSNNSFAFSSCNEASCAKKISESSGFISNIDVSKPVYTACAQSNVSFTVESTKDISYQGGSYKIIKASIPSDMTSKHETWCGDYRKLCESYGHRPVVASKAPDSTCEREYQAITPSRNELSAPEKLNHLVWMAGYLNSSNKNIFAFNKNCHNTCSSDLLDHKSVNESALHVDRSIVSEKNYVVYAVCMNSDSNFHVVDRRRFVHENRHYLILKTRIPHDGISKFNNWCIDYQKLCRGYQMRPVTFPDSQSPYRNLKSCTRNYMSVVIPRNVSSNVLAREYVANIANLAGYNQASRNNSFVFRECDPKYCPRVLGVQCSLGLDCLTSIHREMFTLCTDSDSNFVVEQVYHRNHIGSSHLEIYGWVPRNSMARHGNWCSDYQHLCNSFSVQPTACVNSWNSSKNSSCHDSFQCQYILVDNIGPTNESFVILLYPALESHFKVLETKQYEYNEQRLTIAKTQLISNNRSFTESWCQDYSNMCSSLGKRPFSCSSQGDQVQYKTREKYNTFLSDKVCPSTLVLSSLARQAGFPLVTMENVLGFINCTECAKTLSSEVHCSVVVDLIGELIAPAVNQSCCKCSDTTVDSNNTLVTSILTNSSFSNLWKTCVALKSNHMFNCSLARDCLNDTLMANNSCELLSKCFYGYCFDCCACNYASRNVCHDAVLMKECKSGRNCAHFPSNSTQEIYTFCSDFSDSNFEVQEVRESEYAGTPLTVIQAKVPSHGYSKSASWCEDYEKLCDSIGKRPVGCGKESEVLKRSRDCRLKHDAIMFEGMSCPASKELAEIAVKSGFSATVNQTLGLWSCDQCSRNFSDVWNYTVSSLEVYAVCSGSNSNFNVLEKRTVKYSGSQFAVVMATLPEDGLSLHKDWCQDYLLMCQSYGLRPVACGNSGNSFTEHAECREHYQALVFSDNTVTCSGGFNVHSIAHAAGFKEAQSTNSFVFKSCLPHRCTKSLTSASNAEHSFGQFSFDPTNDVVYTLCASSASSYDVVATRSITIDHQSYLVVRARIPSDGQSKYNNWCKDYQRLCEGYEMRPLTCKKSDKRQRMCTYDYEPFNMAANARSCPVPQGVADIAQQAGFDNVSADSSFAFDYCDATSCVAKIPNERCVDNTVYDTLYETNTTQANISLVEYIVMNITNATGVVQVINTTRSCLILPDPDPPFTVNGTNIADVLRESTCAETLQLSSAKISYFNMTVNQTFPKYIPRIVRTCTYLSPSSLAKVSGEVNTLCVQPSAATNFGIKDTKKITRSEREYLVIKLKLLSSTSKSQSWCTDYMNLCQSLGTSPLACPRAYSFNTDYSKCVSSYEAIMMTSVNYNCPSNDFVSQLAKAAGYLESCPTNSFSLFNCHEDKCSPTLPLTGCSESLHCLSQQVLHKHVYTACVVANSDSNFHVIEKLTKTISGQQYTAIRSRLPAHGRSLHNSWCLDYQRLCESFNLRPLHCGTTTASSDVCKEKFSTTRCPYSIYRIARNAGFGSEPNSQNSFSFQGCDSCSSVLTSTCHSGLNCLKSGISLDEVYTVCGKVKTSFMPLETKRIPYGSLIFRVILAKLTSKTSPLSNWGKDYEELCQSYNELPTGCGKPAAEKDPGVYACSKTFSSYVLPGGELQCNPNDVISKLARDAGFINASPNNSFGFSSCATVSGSTLSTSCYGNLPCLTWQESDPFVYTVCVKPSVSNFAVLSTKRLDYLMTNYLVIHAQIPSDGKSLGNNWCHDYQKLCESYGMRPTGCGGSAIHQSNYSTCSSTYGSYMPASNQLGCGDSKIASRIANKAGYVNSLPANTFVFHNCEECGPVLSNNVECDGALGCISPMVWKKEVYTICVDPPTNFNVLKTANVEYNGMPYLVIEAKLPSDGRAKLENWCRDYEMLCKVYNRRPVSCDKKEDSWECVTKYQSVTQPGFPCDTAPMVASSIAVAAGFSQATTSNSFVLKNCDATKCSKDLPAAGCDHGLSCLNSNIIGNVYAICADSKSNFRVLSSKKMSLPGAVITVVSAVLPQYSAGTWCQDYSKLCHSIGQSPLVLSSDALNENILKCRDDFGGVILPKEVQEFKEHGVHHVAKKAGYEKAGYGNTFAFKSCSPQYCSNGPYAFNCSQALQCLNGEGVERTVYGLCVENLPSTNFYVLDTKTVTANKTSYLVLKVRLPVHRSSKYESWCNDYEHLCYSYNMKPLTTTNSLTCQWEYHAVIQPHHSNLSLLHLVHEVGFYDASSDNLYFLQQCGATECKRQFYPPHCTTGHCSNFTDNTRDFYTLCSSLDEKLATNFDVQEVRNVWLNAAFLVARVKLPSHGLSAKDNWCEEYQTFCESYGKRPYTSAGVLKKEIFDYGACFWKYNATSYHVPVASLDIVQKAGFNPSSGCTSSLHHCFSCGKYLDTVECPLENCQAARETCQDYHIICT